MSHLSFKEGLIYVTPNLIVWDLEHPSFWPADGLRALAFSDTNPAISNMMIAGQWMGEEDNFFTSLCSSDNYKEALKEAKSRLKILKNKITI